tara:strand:+ start:579 stop:1577 length:999 start_codon:yes stop_codon:yes gene_type:complete
MQFLIPFVLLILSSCEDNVVESSNDELLFIACEGNFGASNGSIEVFKNKERVQTVENIGDIVQSLLVHEDMLFVAINNSHKIKKYFITNDGLSLPGIEVNTDNSSPREMCILDGKLYFTNWNSKDIKVLDLYNYNLETFVSLQYVPEDILTDGTYLWLTTPNIDLYDQNLGSKVLKFDSNSNILEIFEVGLGPEKLYLDEDMLYVSRTMYDQNWAPSYGSSVINISSGETTIINNYGAGAACRSDIFKFNNNIHRATTQGAVPLDTELNLNMAAKVGDLNGVYSGKAFNNQLLLGSTDYSAPDTVFLFDGSNELLQTFEVNVLPGDFAIYNN